LLKRLDNGLSFVLSERFELSAHKQIRKQMDSSQAEGLRPEIAQAPGVALEIQ
jgi:hypothetical protein